MELDAILRDVSAGEDGRLGIVCHDRATGPRGA